MKQLMHEADEYVLGRVDSSQLPMIAAHALARGIESLALCELAGLSRADVREAGDLFPVAMSELGHPLRDPQTVLWDGAAQAAQSLLDGNRDVGDAIDEIAWLLCKADHKLPRRAAQRARDRLRTTAHRLGREPGAASRHCDCRRTGMPAPARHGEDPWCD